ncbi:MAG: WbqC family protein [Candidatus Aminicenantes bacterium]|nr:MAG: WbqC family protein [Candidatus Aminicenantes bacterium]
MANKKMIAAIHQPNFLPWLGYFYKMLKSDYFVFLDDVQYIRRGYTSRVKIKTPQGEKWLTVPVKKKGRYHQLVSEVELEPDNKWKNKISGTLQSCCGKAPHFKSYFPGFEKIIQKDHRLLAGLNIELIKWLARAFGIDIPMVKSSQLPGVTGQASERLVTICKALGATQYLSGFGGQNYQEKEVFEREGIQLLVYDFQHPEYPQLFGDFTPGLSAVDLLFNCGPQSAEILREI